MTTLRVLVVDDLAANRDLAARLLVELGHGVVRVENGALAVARCAAEAFDVVLLDVQMPVMDGFTAFERLRALPDARSTAIISWSAGFRIPGCDAILAKPCDLAELRLALEEALLTRRGDRT